MDYVKYVDFSPLVCNPVVIPLKKYIYIFIFFFSLASYRPTLNFVLVQKLHLNRDYSESICINFTTGGKKDIRDSEERRT